MGDVKQLIVQCATGATYNAMLQATYARHSTYAAAHDFDFWCLQGWPWAIGWARFDLMVQALAAGYDYVAWLDADAAIIDLEVDLATALPPGGNIGAVYYDYNDIPSEQPAHWQVGVCYARNTQRTRAFLAELLTNEPAPYRPWAAWWVDPNSEQRIFNSLVQKAPWRDIPYAIGEQWNTTYGHEHGVTPVVLHLAGQTGPGRIALLQQMVDGV